MKVTRSFNVEAREKRCCCDAGCWQRLRHISRSLMDHSWTEVCKVCCCYRCFVCRHFPAETTAAVIALQRASQQQQQLQQEMRWHLTYIHYRVYQ